MKSLITAVLDVLNEAKVPQTSKNPNAPSDGFTTVKAPKTPLTQTTGRHDSDRLTDDEKKVLVTHHNKRGNWAREDGDHKKAQYHQSRSKAHSSPGAHNRDLSDAEKKLLQKHHNTHANHYDSEGRQHRKDSNFYAAHYNDHKKSGKKDHEDSGKHFGHDRTFSGGGIKKLADSHKQWAKENGAKRDYHKKRRNYYS